MIYDTLLIDLDGTVLDFEANQEQALTKLFLNRGIELTEEMRQYYRDFNARLWLEHETGKISVRELCDTRFARFLAHFGHTVDGADWEREYREYLGEGSQTMPHALEVCGELARECRLYVATNGVRKTQMRRLTDSGLLPLFRISARKRPSWWGIVRLPILRAVWNTVCLPSGTTPRASRTAAA